MPEQTSFAPDLLMNKPKLLMLSSSTPDLTKILPLLQRRTDGCRDAFNVESLKFQPFLSFVTKKLKTRVINKDVNPEWNEDLTLSVIDPNHPVSLTVYDHDTFSKDDKMGDADFDFSPFIEALRTNVTGPPNGTVIKRVQPSKHNCLVDESCIYYSNGKIIQDMILRLRNVECGEVEIQLHWIDLPGSKGL